MPMLEEVVAKNDGSPLYLSYGDTDCFSPNRKYKTRWVYDGEPPHGDSWHLVWLDDKLLPGIYWGRGHAWSPDSMYFTLEKYVKDATALYVVRIADLHWFKVAVHSGAKSFLYPNIIYRKYGSTTEEEYVFTGNEAWTAIDFKFTQRIE
jgi:hypothetical protein